VPQLVFLAEALLVRIQGFLILYVNILLYALQRKNKCNILSIKKENGTTTFYFEDIK
jgi:hypothetical protein